MIFSGSYDSADVQFLLEPIDMPPTPVPEREKLIQSGERHYSELLAPEMVPSAEYIELYQEDYTNIINYENEHYQVLVDFFS